MIKIGDKVNFEAITGYNLTINRPDGSVDVVFNDSYRGTEPEKYFAKAVAATKAAGRGDIVKFEVVKEACEYIIDEKDVAAEEQKAWEDERKATARLYAAGEYTS